ncbi:MAG: DUF998 domain-containing protein [Promethearchaeota archaeon]
MINLTQSLSQLYKAIPRGSYGLLSVGVMLLGNLIAIFSFPGYSILDYNISHLALSPGGIYFNLSLIISGLFAIPFNINLGKAVDGENVNNNLKKRVVSISIVDSIALSLIGVFPAYPENLVILTIHGLLALIFFVSTTIIFLLYGYLFLKSLKFVRVQAYLSFIVAIIICIYMTLRWSILEWIAFFGIMISVFYTSIFLLYKKY